MNDPAPVADNLASLRKSLQIYKGLVEVSGLINSITDYSKLLRAILDVARRVARAEAASLFLVNPTSGALELAIATSGESDYVEPRLTVPRGKGIAGWVFERGEPLLVPDAYQDERFFKDADKQTGFVTRSLVCAPLRGETGMIGVLEVLNPGEMETIGAEEFEGFCAYADLIATALEKLRTLEKIRAQERVERDLAIAAEIQGEILSRAIPAPLAGARFAAHNAAAANVGGDFYGVFPQGSGEIYFAVGDVSGKGISAALLMAQTFSAMHFVFGGGSGPAAVLSRLNDSLQEGIVRGMFITMLVGRLLPSSRTLEMSSAGHCLPLHVTAGGAASKVETHGSMPLGILPEVSYRQVGLVLGKGERIVFYTDGLTESRSADGEEFEASLLGCVAGPADGPEELLARILDAERQHRGQGHQLDDLTVLVGGFE